MRWRVGRSPAPANQLVLRYVAISDMIALYDNYSQVYGKNIRRIK